MRHTFLLLAATGCFQPVLDASQPCVLVRAGPDGGAEPIPNDDPAIAYSANRDIISFGGTDCPTRICVRDATFRYQPGSGPAVGYCSLSCGTCPAGMTCRALLDEETLKALKVADPERYRKLFGDAEPPSFCARGG
jgi:hypothetical protein